MKEVMPGVYRDGKNFYTENLSKGKKFFDEKTLRFDGKEYRLWDPRSSKLCSSLVKGMNVRIPRNSKVLYLGASHGYTASFVSDIVTEGFVFALDFAPRVVRDLVFVSEERPNMAPMLMDAKNPQNYYHYMAPADFIFQDIAQKEQIEIFLRNTRLYLKKGCDAMIAVKARSIDTTKEPKKVFAIARQQLEAELKVIDSRQLEPFQKDHCVFLCRRR